MRRLTQGLFAATLAVPVPAPAVTGGIDKFSINTTRGGFGGVGGNVTTADASINVRFVDTTSAVRVISIAASGQVTKGGGFVGGATLSREAEWGIDVRRRRAPKYCGEELRSTMEKNTRGTAVTSKYRHYRPHLNFRVTSGTSASAEVLRRQ